MQTKNIPSFTLFVFEEEAEDERQSKDQDSSPKF